MTAPETARTLIEKAGKLLDQSERLFLRQVLAGIALAAGEMWDELTRTFAHLIS